MSNRTLVMGLFVSTGDAERALGSLIATGIPRDEISAIAADRRAPGELGIERHSKVGSGAAIGAGFGGALGALLAGFTAVGAIATGGAMLMVTGPLVAALAGAGAGAAAGGVLGGLVGLGIPEHEVKFFSESLSKGAVLLGVRVDQAKVDEVKKMLEQHGASRITVQGVKTADEREEQAAAVDRARNVTAEEWAVENPLRRLFVDQLRDIYYAEHELLKALQELASAASSPELAQAFHDHREQTKGHISRLDSVFEKIGVRAEKKKCPAIAGILSEAGELMKLDETYPQRDAAMVCAAQKAEHYEIGTYGCLRTYAQTLGLTDAAAMLEQTLGEEWEADRKLTALAESGINQLATVATP